MDSEIPLLVTQMISSWMDDEEILRIFPNGAARKEWTEMQELQRQAERQEKLEVEKRLREIMRINEGWKATRQSETQEVLHCLLCNLTGDAIYAEYTNR
jgi:hypothetical protein